MKTTPNSIGQPVARLGNLRTFLCAAALVALVAPDARASDPNGIYAFVDRVVFEPSDAAPERIQVWGGFALAKNGGDQDQDAERGYMYFKLRPGSEAICKKEWTDLKSVAGTRQIVTFGSREEGPLTVRKPGAKAENPDVYPRSWSMVKATTRENYAPMDQLKRLMGDAKESSPAKGMSPKKETPDAPKAGGS